MVIVCDVAAEYIV